MAKGVRTARKKDEGGPRGTPGYMLTFGDMTALLLIFFIALFNPGKQATMTATQAISSFSQALGVFPASISVLRPDEALLVPAERGTKHFWGEEKKMSELEKKLREEIAKMAQAGTLGEYVQIKRMGKEIQITLGSKALFDLGKDDLRSEFMPVLDKISNYVKQNHLKMLVEGHTDSIPISTARFPSNWELSTARATQVVRYMVNKHGIEPTNLTAVGYGEYKPVDDNATPEGRQKNRRIEIKLSPTELTPPGTLDKVDDIFGGASF
ncbi:MAG: OmpA family protein [bacterium]